MRPLIKRAFVLGAGLGTRLGVLTRHLPKPLVPICQKPLITFAFDHLIGNAIEEFVVNTHHCPEAYSAAFPGHKYRNCPIRFRHEPDLLETAGGLRNVAELLGDAPFVVYNGDILCDLPLGRALQAHREQQNEVTLVLRSSGGPLQVACEPASGQVLDIGQRLEKNEGRRVECPRFLFSGIYVVEPRFLERIPPATKLSVIPVFMELIRESKLGGVVIDEGRWWDLGTRNSYLDVHKHYSGHPEPWQVWTEPRAKIDPGVQLLGATAVGAGAHIGAGAVLEDCVVWENAQIAGGARLRNCIVTAAAKADGCHADRDF